MVRTIQGHAPGSDRRGRASATGVLAPVVRPSVRAGESRIKRSGDQGAGGARPLTARAIMPEASSTGNQDSARTLRETLEEFLYREAALLDAWRLDEWLALLT